MTTHYIHTSYEGCSHSSRPKPLRRDGGGAYMIVGKHAVLNLKLQTDDKLASQKPVPPNTPDMLHA